MTVINSGNKPLKRGAKDRSMVAIKLERIDLRMDVLDGNSKVHQLAQTPSFVPPA